MMFTVGGSPVVGAGGSDWIGAGSGGVLSMFVIVLAAGREGVVLMIAVLSASSVLAGSLLPAGGVAADAGTVEVVCSPAIGEGRVETGGTGGGREDGTGREDMGGTGGMPAGLGRGEEDAGCNTPA